MRKFQKTAIAAAVAQIAVLYSGAAWAQTTGTSAEEPSVPATAVVKVSGQRAALQSAQQLKQNSDELVDSIVAEDIGKLPDRSVTEVLQRIAGITMDRNMPGDPNRQAVEGSGVSVRGLTYVRSEVNGRDAFSAGGGRSLGFTDVPPELMAGVDVYKNPSAEQIEGALAGLVNLRTAMPFDFKGFKGSLGASQTYSELNKAKGPTGTVLLSNRWDSPIGEFGALVNFAYAKNPTRTDAIGIDPYFPHVNSRNPAQYRREATKWLPLGGGLRSQEFERVRRGDYAAFQWRPNRDLTAALTYFKTEYDEDLSERVVASSEDKWYQQVAGADVVYDSQGAFQKGTISNPTYGGSPFNSSRRINQRNSGTRDLALNVQWRVTPDLTWTNDIQHIRSTTEGFDADVSTGFILPNQSIDLTGSVPQIGLGSAQFMADPKNYYWAYTQEALDRAKATQKAWRSDLKLSFDDPVLRDIRFGVRVANREAENRKAQKFYNWSSITFPWMEGWQIPGVARLSDPRFAGGVELAQIPNFFDGKVSVPAMLYPTDALARDFPTGWTKLHNYHTILCEEQKAAQGWGTCDAWKPSTFDTPSALNTQTERTQAAYTQLRFGFDDLKYPIDGNIGVRYVGTKNTTRGYIAYDPTNVSIPGDVPVEGVNTLVNIGKFETPRSTDTSYHHWLPSLNLRMKVTDKLQFRFAVAKSMARPDFNQLQSLTTLSSPANQLTIKDPVTLADQRVVFSGNNLTGSSDGNPLLKPTTATNIDLTAEWYFAKAGSLTLAAFNKDIKDIIVNTTYGYTVKDVNGKDQTFAVTHPINGAHGFARGFEIAHQQYYDFVPEWLRGIGTQASWTYVSSERKLDKPVPAAFCAGSDASNMNLSINGCDTDGRPFGNTPLQGLSRHTVNFALMYEKSGLSMRLAYNWRSRYLVAVNTWGSRGNNGLNTNPDAGPRFLIPTPNNDQAYGLPLWQDDYGQLDGSIFYDFTDRFRIGLAAQNLNNAKTRQVMQQHAGMFTRQLFMSGPRYTIQAAYSF